VHEAFKTSHSATLLLMLNPIITSCVCNKRVLTYFSALPKTVTTTTAVAAVAVISIALLASCINK
jgi:hypothetical protein